MPNGRAIRAQNLLNVEIWFTWLARPQGSSVMGNSLSSKSTSIWPTVLAISRFVPTEKPSRDDLDGLLAPGCKSNIILESHIEEAKQPCVTAQLYRTAL